MTDKEIATQIAVAAINKINYDTKELDHSARVQVEYMVELGVRAYYFALSELERQRSE
jgi:hypothetical protein